MNHPKFLLAAAALTILSQVQAAPVYDANITNNVIMGSGITNGGWTVDTTNNVELGLRAKVRYDTSTNAPTNDFNSNGDGTYSHAAGSPLSNPTRARWNFEWSVNSDAGGTSGLKLDSLTFVLGIDSDAGVGTSFSTINLFGAPGDHAFGNNGTAQSAGTVAANAGAFTTLVQTSNLAQNSWNMDFFDNGALFAGLFMPSADGEYSFYLQAMNATGAVLSRTDITVIVGAGATVPEPGTLALAGLALLGVVGARRRKA